MHFSLEKEEKTSSAREVHTAAKIFRFLTFHENEMYLNMKILCRIVHT